MDSHDSLKKTGIVIIIITTNIFSMQLIKGHGWKIFLKVHIPSQHIRVPSQSCCDPKTTASERISFSK